MTTMGHNVNVSGGDAPNQGYGIKSSKAGIRPPSGSPYGEGGKGFDPSGMEEAASLVKAMPGGKGGAIFAQKKVEELTKERRTHHEKKAELKEYSSQVVWFS